MMRVFSFLIFAMFSVDCLAVEPRIVKLGQVEGVSHLVIDPNTGVVFGKGTAGGFAILAGEPLQRLVDIPFVERVPLDAIPHAGVATGKNQVRRAWLVQPTGRYDHGVLGDLIEAGALKVQLRDGREMVYELGDQYVFEDLTPRLADMDGDGLDEIILARSSLSEGAAVSVYRIGERQIEQFAVSPSIGFAYRWLNPVGAGDFDADGEMDIAVVETPHLGKTLVIYGREVSRLQSIGRAEGFSTHSIGSTVLEMAVIADLNGDGVLDIVLPNGGKNQLIAVTFRGRKFLTIWEGPKGAAIVTEVLRVDIDANGSKDILYGRKDGTVEAILQ
jgi:hypothetical protein